MKIGGDFYSVPRTMVGPMHTKEIRQTWCLLTVEEIKHIIIQIAISCNYETFVLGKTSRSELTWRERWG